MPTEIESSEALRTATQELWQLLDRLPSDRLPNRDEFNELQAAIGRVRKLSDQYRARDTE